VTRITRHQLDRAALERVLARAAELQSRDTGETGGALTDDQILELGKEVGLTPEALRQAMAEERGRVVIPEAGGVLGSWLGAPSLSASRVVPGTVTGVLEAIDTVIRGELPFDISRRFPDRMQWTPKRGFLDLMRSQFARGTEAPDLRLAEEVAATVVPVDNLRVHVRFDATVAAARRQAVSSTVTAGAVSGLLAFAVGITGAPVLLAIPLFAGGSGLGALAFRGRFRRTAGRISVALEQLLDRLEFGPAKRKGSIVDKLLG
jgi:hypothetical protein